MRVDKSKWQKKTIGQIGKVISGSTPRTDNPSNWEGGTYNWVTPAELKGDKYYGSTIKKITDTALESTNLTLMPIGTVLLSSRAPIGKVAITTEPMYCNQGFKNIECNSSIHNEFLYYYLRYNNDELNRRGNGVTFKEISKKIVEQFPVIVPSLEEQKGIASELDAIQTMIDGYKAQITDLDELANSIFLETFGDPITNDKGWELTNLENVSNNNGSYGAGSPSAPKEPNRPRYIRITDIDDNGYLNNDFVVSSNIEDDTSYLLKFGDILFARTGATVGKTYLYTTSEPQIYAGYLIKFSLNIDVVSPIFIYHITKTEAYKYWLKNQIIGAAQPNVNAKKYSALPIILPPLVLQEEFAKKIKVIEKQKEMLFEQLADAEQLMAERMQYYFS